MGKLRDPRIANMFGSLWKHRFLIIQLTKRDILQRYKGSLLGIGWSFINPLLMLAVYTFVFGFIFETRWNVQIKSKADFAMVLFCGLTAFNIFAETLSRSSGVVLSNPNYIKKVVFPLEILPVTLLGSALINGAISFLVLVLANLALTGTLHSTILCLPLVLLPLLLISLGFGWLLGSLGVFLRDLGQVVPVAVTALLFLSPIFYPVAAVPEAVRFLHELNPLSYVVEDARQVVLWGDLPNWRWLGLGTLIGYLFALPCYLWFQRTKKGFADVV